MTNLQFWVLAAIVCPVIGAAINHAIGIPPRIYAVTMTVSSIFMLIYFPLALMAVGIAHEPAF